MRQSAHPSAKAVGVDDNNNDDVIDDNDDNDNNDVDDDDSAKNPIAFVAQFGFFSAAWMRIKP